MNAGIKATESVFASRPCMALVANPIQSNCRGGKREEAGRQGFRDEKTGEKVAMCAVK